MKTMAQKYKNVNTGTDVTDALHGLNTGCVGRWGRGGGRRSILETGVRYERSACQHQRQCGIYQETSSALYQLHIDQGHDKCQDGATNDQWVCCIQVTNGATSRVRVRLKLGIRLGRLIGQSQQPRGQAKL